MNPSEFENNRHIVLNDYDNEQITNHSKMGMATPEYIFPNQKEDALNNESILYVN